jgi:hypothetical protein
MQGTGALPAAVPQMHRRPPREPFHASLLVIIVTVVEVVHGDAQQLI